MNGPLSPRPLNRETPVEGLMVVVSPAVQSAIDGFLVRLPAPIADKLRPVRQKDVALPPTGHMLLAGNLRTHPWIRDLYFRNWVSTDILHPGRGGYELKTLCGPFAAGRNVILVGASDEDGLDTGLERLAEAMEANPDSLPFLFEVEASEQVFTAANHAEILDFPDRAADSGFWSDHAAAEAGAHAVFTGRQDMAAWFRDYLLNRSPREESEEEMGSLMLLFRLLEPLELWDDRQRGRAAALFHQFMTGPEGIESFGPLDQPLPEEFDGPIQGWICRKALSLYFIADYFHRFHGFREAKQWLERIRAVFGPALRSSKPASDSSGLQWHAVAGVARYALASGESAYLDGGYLRDAAKRALQTFTNQGQQALSGAISGPANAPWLLFAMAAAFYQDASFLAPFEFWDPDRGRLLCPWTCSNEYLRSFAVDLPTRLDPGLVGLFVSPLDDSYRRKSHLLTPGFYQPAPPEAPLFDKVSFRSGFRREDDYLLLDGVSGGEHSYEDAGCIKEIQMRGFPWVCSLDAGMRESGIATQNGVLLLRDGQRTPLQQFAELLDSHFSAAGGHVVVRLSGYSGAHWTRSVFWRAAGFVLVIDEVEVDLPGRYLMEAGWLCLGRLAPGPWPVFELGESEANMARFSVAWEQQVDSLMEPVDFCDEFYSCYIEQNQSEYELYPTCEVPPTLHRIRLRKVFDGQPGQKASIATRFLCTRPGEAARKQYSLERDTTVIFVEVPGDKVEAFPFVDQAQKLSLESEIESVGGQMTLYPRRPTAVAVCPHGAALLVGFEDGHLLSMEPGTREVVFESTFEGRVNAVASVIFGGRVYSYAGTEEGPLACFDAEGNVVWHKEADIPEDRTWDKLEPRWSSHEPSIRALAAQAVGDDAILVAGHGDGFIYRLDPLTGAEAWEAQLNWGCASHLAIADIDADGSPEIVVGTAFPSAHGSVQLFSLAGARLDALTTPYDSSWSMPSQVTALLVDDLDGDGRTEILRGAANHIEHVALWRGRELLWSVDCGECPATLSAIPGRWILVGSRSGWVFVVDLQGQILYRDYLGETIRCSIPCQDGFWVGGQDGGLFRVDGQKREVVILRRFSSSVERLVSVRSELIALMESGEIHAE
jgi:hypothetical protein